MTNSIRDVLEPEVKDLGGFEARRVLPHRKFRHYPATDIPIWQYQGVSITLVAGQAYGRTSPVQTFSPMIYLDVQLPDGTQFTLPPD